LFKGDDTQVASRVAARVLYLIVANGCDTKEAVEALLAKEDLSISDAKLLDEVSDENTFRVCRVSVSGERGGGGGQGRKCGRG
jgi:hypothetical protein